MSNTKRQDMAAALHRLANDIADGRLPIPYDISVGNYWQVNEDGTIGEAHTVDTIHATMAATPGDWSKRYAGEWIVYEKQYHKSVTVSYALGRDLVCKKVQVGTRTVEAREAYDEPVYEWKCE